MRDTSIKAMAAVALLVASCTAGKVTKDSNFPNGNISVNGKMFAAAYIQTAAEFKALCYQSYQLATLRLDQHMQLSSKSLRPAIVTDIDETLLNNTPYEVNNTMQGKSYELSTWYQWTGLALADTLPGALTFLKYAKARGADIFYITNRDEVERSGTLRNLQKFGFPDADSAHLFLREKSSSKESRRLRVMQTHEIVLLLGDNLSDFSAFFDKKSAGDRRQQVDALRNEFGNRFIVIPNPLYGDWESALYKYDHKLLTPQKDSAMRASLKGY